MEKRGSNIAPHSLTEAELTDGSIEQRFKAEHRDQFVSGACVVTSRYRVDIAQKIKRLDNWKIPPELCSLSEYNSNTPNMVYALFPGHPAGYHAPTGCRNQNAGQGLNCSAFSGAVRADIANQFAWLQ
jgi:hypothetical protein